MNVVYCLLPCQLNCRNIAIALRIPLCISKRVKAKIMALLERQPYDAVHHPHIVIRGLLELLFQMIRTRIHAENGPNHFQ